jgi:putative FmdB family regulatory protein
MPIYTYRCEDCGVQFERNQKFSDAPLTRCPECGKKSLRKVYTPVGIVFKGSGFYSTDHRSPSGGRSASSHDEKSASSDSSKPAESEASASKSGTSEQGSAEKTAPAKNTPASSKGE